MLLLHMARKPRTFTLRVRAGDTNQHSKDSRSRLPRRVDQTRPEEYTADQLTFFDGMLRV